MEHRLIVRMGVDAQVWDAAPAVADGCIENAVSFAVGSNAVDGAVFIRVVEPCTVLNKVIGRVGPDDESEDTEDLAVLFDDVAGAFFNIADHFGLGREFIAPLGGVAVPLHQFAGISISLPDRG